jgi:hypothetical protein
MYSLLFLDKYFLRNHENISFRSKVIPKNYWKIPVPVLNPPVYNNTHIPYMNLGVYILWLFVLPTYGTWIKVYTMYVYIYIVTACPTYIHVKQKYNVRNEVLKVQAYVQ